MGVNREKAIADVGEVIEAPQMARAWKDFGSVGAPAFVRYAVDQRECVLDLRAALKKYVGIRDHNGNYGTAEQALEAQ